MTSANENNLSLRGPPVKNIPALLAAASARIDASQHKYFQWVQSITAATPYFTPPGLSPYAHVSLIYINLFNVTSSRALFVVDVNT